MTLGGTIAVATDARDSAHMVRSAMVAGMMAVGADVVDLGLVPTPALQYYVRTHPVSGGVMVTASHNPQEYNGMKLILAGGTEATVEDEAELESSYGLEDRDVGWSDVGGIRRETGAVEDYVDAIVSNVDADAIRDAGLRVCVDCACGAASASTPLLLRRLGVRSLTLGCDPVGVPHRESDPTPDNLGELTRMTVESGADLGVAHDGDGGRAIFVDRSGRVLNGSVSGAIVARSILSRARGQVVTPVSSSGVLQDVVESSGGLVRYTAVITHEVVRKMVENKAVFGVEEHGGMIFPEMQMCRDGGMALARMLEVVAKEGDLGSLASSLPPYTLRKTSVRCPEGAKATVMDSLLSEAVDRPTDTTDGLKVFYDDGWVLLRPSTSEETFRIYSDTRGEGSDDRLLGYASRVRDLVGSWEAGRVDRGSWRGPPGPRLSCGPPGSR